MKTLFTTLKQLLGESNVNYNFDINIHRKFIFCMMTSLKLIILSRRFDSVSNRKRLEVKVNYFMFPSHASENVWVFPLYFRAGLFESRLTLTQD